MTAATFDPNTPAARLASAWRTGLRLAHLPEAERPRSIAEGYAVQDAMVNSLVEGIAGWKIAGASPRGLRGELPNAPATGYLVASRVFASGTVVQLPAGAQMTLETEVSFRFARTVSPADEAFDARSMIERANVSIEVVCSRFTDRKSVGQPSYLGDNVGFHAFVWGESLAFPDGALFAEEAGIWHNGERIANSLSGDDRTQPFQSLAFLWNILRQQEKKIPEGSIVTTGTLSVPVDISRAGDYEARVGNARVGLTLAI